MQASQQERRRTSTAGMSQASRASLVTLVASAMSLGASRAEALQATLRSRPASLKPAAVRRGPLPEKGLRSSYSCPAPRVLVGKRSRPGSTPTTRGVSALPTTSRKAPQAQSLLPSNTSFPQAGSGTKPTNSNSPDKRIRGLAVSLASSTCDSQCSSSSNSSQKSFAMVPRLLLERDEGQPIVLRKWVRKAPAALAPANEEPAKENLDIITLQPLRQSGAPPGHSHMGNRPSDDSSMLPCPSLTLPSMTSSPKVAHSRAYDGWGESTSNEGSPSGLLRSGKGTLRQPVEPLLLTSCPENMLEATLEHSWPTHSSSDDSLSWMNTAQPHEIARHEPSQQCDSANVAAAMQRGPQQPPHADMNPAAVSGNESSDSDQDHMAMSATGHSPLVTAACRASDDHRMSPHRQEPSGPMHEVTSPHDAALQASRSSTISTASAESQCVPLAAADGPSAASQAAGHESGSSMEWSIAASRSPAQLPSTSCRPSESPAHLSLLTKQASPLRVELTPTPETNFAVKGTKLVGVLHNQSKGPMGPFQEEMLMVLPMRVGKQDLQDPRRLQATPSNVSCRPGVTSSPAEPPHVATLQTNPAFDLHEALPQDTPLLNNPTFEGIGTLAYAKRPFAAAPPALAASIAVVPGAVALPRTVTFGAAGAGYTHSNAAVERCSDHWTPHPRDAAFLQGWGNPADYSPVAVKSPSVSQQVRLSTPASARGMII